MPSRLLPLILLLPMACTTPGPAPPPAPTTVAPPLGDDELRALVAAFLTQAETSMVEATKQMGTAAFQQRAIAEEAVCVRAANEHPDEVPLCGSEHFTFGWQEPLELAAVDVVKHAGDAMTVRANMRYPEGFLGTPANDPPHFFAQLDLVRVDGAWRVADVRTDDEATIRDRGLMHER